MGARKKTDGKRNPKSLANLKKGKGRPPGRRNKVTREAKDLCNRIVNDPRYLKALKQRMIDGEAGSMEPVVWYYAKGKPATAIDVNLLGFDPLPYLARPEEAPID